MREEKFSEVYKKYGSLVIRMLLAGCKNEEVAQRLCFQVFQGYYLRMGMLSDSLIRPWIIWFTRKQVKEYRRTHEKDGTPKEPVEVLGKKENPPRSDLRIQASLDQMARNHTDKSVLEDLKEKNEDWYKMVYLRPILAWMKKSLQRTWVWTPCKSAWSCMRPSSILSTNIWMN